MTSAKPVTLGELQLYKVLQRANLLSYYESFISQGGDDVQQLCEAGEEEFLEIMALVGMACKPLHVRRLQKSLQEWVTQPSLFRLTNVNYLPAQSVSLTSLGIDMRDLVMPPQQCPNSLVNRNDRVLSVSDEEMSNRMKNDSRLTASTEAFVNGGNTLFKIDDTSKRLTSRSLKNGVTNNREADDEVITSSFLDSIVQKHIASSIIPPRKDIIAQLHADKETKEIALAASLNDRNKFRVLINDYVKKIFHNEGLQTRQGALIKDAAVRLCLADESWLLKTNDLMTTAQKIAKDVELKHLGRRRSSTHLHGSTCQSRLQELSQLMQKLKNNRNTWEKKLLNAQNNKNVIEENECQNNLERISREESAMLSEMKEVKEKIESESKENSSSILESFSSELAELAKAHNLSLGNLQTPASSSDLTASRKNLNSTHNGVDSIPDSNCNAKDFDSQSRGSRSSTPVLLQVKVENAEEVTYDCSVQSFNSRSSKRKLSGSISNIESNSKKLTLETSRDNE